MGRGRLSTRDADAETTLSSLFAADEVAKSRRGWGSSLLSSAVSATVFGAAIGLTAYRIWTGGWGSIVPEHPEGEAEDEAEDEGDGEYEDASPPPSEPAEPFPPLPFPSRTPRRKYASSMGSSSAPRRYTPSRRRRRAKRPSSARSASVEYTDTDAPLDPITSEGESGDETNARLAAMAHRVQGLIAEGQAALSSPVGTPRRVPTPRFLDFPAPPPRETLPAQDHSHTQEGEGDGGGGGIGGGGGVRRVQQEGAGEEAREERVPGWDTDTTAPASLYGALSRPVSAASVSGSFPRSTSSSSSSRYQPAIPPLPWRRESFGAGATSRWVQKQHSPTHSVAKNEVPLVLTRGSPGVETARLPLSPQVQTPSPQTQAQRPSVSPHAKSLPPTSPRDSGSRIPRPGHSRASSVASGADSPSPVVRRERERDAPSRLSLDRGGWNSPAPPQGLVAARTSMFASVAERNSSNRSKIPIRRSIGSISSISAVQPSPKA
ncbi:hypothetical protein CC85DRAFT_309969 [Cutaneotrichosporon oleaginosum]|uniref:Uncharacterized protein n=1 Tax=Cutaneotrichosporon oleaginosum TaxID=879819 RepID=A0A0J0XZ51_9TREE|nr:uncharacterized protein CC85DRAFT_309969 [Cutaneotrichosporon oleaginosum]KLT46337.1 hypothetical protein CC85DRAFT_309969 [Cutaneotrichosporon oleaginosum]TXT15291.1 hypothetical protein COLE_01484 [Cutaneotrichosporon oleaginosum]